MTNNHSFSEFAADLRRFIDRPDRSAHDQEFNRLALTLFKLQFETVPPYQQFCRARKILPEQVRDWTEIPALPTTAFKEHIVSSLGPSERTQFFCSSGTTQQIRSRHFHNAESLACYEASLEPWCFRHVLPDLGQLRQQQFRLIALTPSPALAPHSSLAHMFEVVRRRCEQPDSVFCGRIEPDGSWTLDFDRTVSMLKSSVAAAQPVVLLGTAFSFVHLSDQLENELALPAGSRVLETGGYKGRSRVLPKADLHTLITETLGIPDSHIVSEYGMSELSSQAYDRSIGRAETRQGQSQARVFRFPGWARAQVISPESNSPVRDGEAGLIRIFDLANVRSVLAIQTEDLAIRRGDGFELLGRNVEAEPRGCSLMSA